MLRFLVILPALTVFAACGSMPHVVHYSLTTNSRLVCCRNLTFAVAHFAEVLPARGTDTGVVVHLAPARVPGDCGKGAELAVIIANHTARDRYIPSSHELSGRSVLLYPWRLWRDSAGQTMRLARQIQYGDLFEHADARLRLMLLPAGSEVHLTGTIPANWLCTPPTEIYPGYLEAELDPGFYAQRSRGLRTSRFEQATGVDSPIGLRYDVVTIGLEFLESLPLQSRVQNGSGDTVRYHFNVTEEPETFFNASQRVAESNVVQLVIAGTNQAPDTSKRR